MGSAVHEEYWIPAGRLPEFNQAIANQIEVDASFFGESFVGFVPEKFGFAGKSAEQQFVILARNWDYSRMDFTLEISANRKAVYLNCLFWVEHDFSKVGISAELTSAALAGVKEAWNWRRISPELPNAFLKAISKA